MKNKTSYFPEVIGQTSAKKKLSFLLDNYNRLKHVPNILFNAPKGSGKTLLAHKMGKNLKKNYTKIKKTVQVGVKELKMYLKNNKDINETNGDKYFRIFIDIIVGGLFFLMSILIAI